MRRAGQKPAVSVQATTIASPVRSAQPRIVVDPYHDEDLLADTGTCGSASTVESQPSEKRQRSRELVIEQRIESRVRGRVRNLRVRVFEGIVILQGQCATYYTKQLAQHAALGVLEDEHLENAILVQVPR